MDPIEGLVLHTVGYEDGGRVRPVLYRASVSEMVVPYGTPDPMHGWKSAFDAGEWGLGRMANSLTLGCDCLGEIHYFDADFADERGHPHTLSNAICMHEEDYGILWKHVDMVTGRTEVRRSRRLVVSSIATVGNYEYGFYWYFYLDGTIQLELKLTGIMSTQAFEPGHEPSHATVVPPGWPPRSTSTCSTSGSTWRSTGRPTPSTRSRRRPDPPGPDNPWGNAFRPHATLLETEGPAQRVVNPGTSRYWKVVNRGAANGLGQPDGLQAGPGADACPAGRPRVQRRAAGRLRHQEPVGDPLRRRTAAGGRRLPQPAPRR